MIKRADVLKIIQSELLERICSLYKIEREQLTIYPEYEGCQNIVFFYSLGNSEYVLRVTYRNDRSFEDIQGEVHFINYLFENSVSVSNPVKSQENHFVEKLDASGINFYVVVFNKAKGIRLPDNNYKYRDGIPINEFYYNYGKTLGKMHRLAKDYVQPDTGIRRPLWLENMQEKLIPQFLPEDKIELKDKIQNLCRETSILPIEKDSYGLIHADFSDGNIAIDYNTGNITVFDFDDSAYCWFMYDLADAWTKGVGWTQFESSREKRRANMNDYFSQVLTGYDSENSITNAWLEKLPFFTKLVAMEWAVGEFQYMKVNEGVIEYDEEIQYIIKCIEEDLPFLGFFDKIYSAEKPFHLI
jgi:Ser/Thr protein kinase RdoA (MazF antagonist)